MPYNGDGVYSKRDMMDYRKIFLLLSILLLSACQPEASPTGEGTAITTTPTQTPSLTRTPSPTHTLAPLPTLSEDAKLTLTKDLLTTNEGCKLPCWWGFIPGETMWEEARRFLETIAILIHPIEYDAHVLYAVGFLVPEEFNPSAGEDPDTGVIYNDFFIEEGVIIAIEVEVGPSHTFDLSYLLKEYGQPDQIYIETDPERFQGSLQTALIIFYQSLGIYAYYEVPGTEMGDEIQACFENDKVSRMMLWPPEIEWSYLEKTRKTQFIPPIREFLLLEEVTDMDEEIFYQKYKGTTEPICITVPREPFYYYDERPTRTPGPCVFPGEPFN
jgi:hypothetical protein